MFFVAEEASVNKFAEALLLTQNCSLTLTHTRKYYSALHSKYTAIMITDLQAMMSL